MGTEFSREKLMDGIKSRLFKASPEKVLEISILLRGLALLRDDILVELDARPSMDELLEVYKKLGGRVE